MINRERYFASNLTEAEIAAFVRRLRSQEFSRYSPIPDCDDCPDQPKCWWPRECMPGLKAWLDSEKLK